MTTDRVTTTYALRFPDGLRQKLKDTARDTRRSMHSEILTRLSGTYSGQIDQSVYSSLTSRLAEKTLLRLPRDLHAQLKSAAEANGRSLNAECVWRLLASYTHPSPAPSASMGRVTVLEFMDPADDEAIAWISANATALRTDGGSLLYGMATVVKAFQAGKAASLPTQESEDGR